MQNFWINLSDRFYSLKENFVNNKRTAFSILGLVILLLGIPIGIYLALNPQIFNPRANTQSEKVQLYKYTDDDCSRKEGVNQSGPRPDGVCIEIKELKWQ